MMQKESRGILQYSPAFFFLKMMGITTWEYKFSGNIGGRSAEGSTGKEDKALVCNYVERTS